MLAQQVEEEESACLTSIFQTCLCCAFQQPHAHAKLTPGYLSVGSLRHFHVQVEVYRGLLRSKRITSLLYGVGSCSDSEGILPAITVLKKLCNHPKLVYKEQQQQQGAVTGPQQQQQSTGKACSKTAELAGSILHQHLPGVGLPLDAVKLSGAIKNLSPCSAC